MLVAVGDDVLGNRGIDARNTAEKCRGGGVEIHADMVDGVLDSRIERFLQFLLAHIMLILSDTDRLWVDFNELCERILKPLAIDAELRSPTIEIWIFFRR